MSDDKKINSTKNRSGSVDNLVNEAWLDGTKGIALPTAVYGEANFREVVAKAINIAIDITEYQMGLKLGKGGSKLTQEDMEFPLRPIDNAISDNTKSILDIAKEIIYGDREKTCGDPAINLKLIAAYWSNHLSSKYKLKVTLTVDDVCGMMILLKQARLANDPNHKDSLVDLCGYAALQERVANSKDNTYPVKCKFKVCDFPACDCSKK